MTICKKKAQLVIDTRGRFKGNYTNIIFKHDCRVNIINLIEYYISPLGDEFIFDKNIVSFFHKSNEKYKLLNNYVNIIDE